MKMMMKMLVVMMVMMTDDGYDRIERYNLRLLTVSSLRRELSPTCTLK